MLKPREALVERALIAWYGEDNWNKMPSDIHYEDREKMRSILSMFIDALDCETYEHYGYFCPFSDG